MSYSGKDEHNFSKINNNKYKELNNKHKELKNSEKKTNTINSHGKILKCNYCGSNFHWVNNSLYLPEQPDKTL